VQNNRDQSIHHEKGKEFQTQSAKSTSQKNISERIIIFISSVTMRLI